MQLRIPLGWTHIHEHVPATVALGQCDGVFRPAALLDRPPTVASQLKWKLWIGPLFGVTNLRTLYSETWFYSLSSAVMQID
jgi:hypothetical protein